MDPLPAGAGGALGRLDPSPEGRIRFGAVWPLAVPRQHGAWSVLAHALVFAAITILGIRPIRDDGSISETRP
jgi:hypothetical protein